MPRPHRVRRSSTRGPALLALATVAVVTFALGSPLASAVSSDTASTVTAPDLALSSSPGGDVTPGVVFTRTVTVRNGGGEAARDVHVVVWLPPGVTVATILPVFEGGTCTVVSVGTGGPLALAADCRRGSLDAGAEATMTLDLRAGPDTPCGSLLTEAETFADNEPASAVGPENESEVTDLLVCTTPPGPDLAVRASVEATPPVPAGDRLTYHLEVRNDGDSEARSVEVFATLPRGVSVSLPASEEWAACTAVSSIVPGARPSTSVTCRAPTLAPGAAATLDVVATVLPDPICGAAVLTAETSAGNEVADNVGPENRAIARTSFACEPEIVAKLTGPRAVHAGDAAAIDLMVRNRRSATALTVRPRIEGCAPDAIRLVDRGDGDRGLSPGETWLFRCRRAVNGTQDPASIAASVVARDELRQKAKARGSFRLDVLHPAIGLDVSASPPAGRPGDAVRYRYTVRNLGDAALSHIRIEDSMIGTVAHVAWLAPGATRTIDVASTLPRADLAVPRTVRVIGADRLGRVVAATVPATVAVLGANDDGTGIEPGADRAPSGSAFTGADVGSPAALAVALWLMGLVALASVRPVRRRRI